MVETSSSDAVRDPGVIWPKERRVTTADGARIGYTFLGPADGPVVALCSGLLCPDTWWHRLAPCLAEHGYRVLLFHYRGVAVSTPPRAPGWHGRGIRRADFTIPRFAEDLAAIVEAEAITSLALVGHSMGVQVALEGYRVLADRVRALALVTGPYASPVRSLFNLPPLGTLLYPALKAAFELSPPPLLRASWRAAWRTLPVGRLGQVAGVLGPRMELSMVETFVEHGAVSDPYVALAIVAGMHAYSAEELLERIDVPALVVVGDRDPFSPAHLSAEMVERMPNAVLRTVHGGTHGAILEYPEVVNGWVLDHLDRAFAAAAGYSSSKSMEEYS